MFDRDGLHFVTLGRLVGGLSVLVVAGLAWSALQPDPPQVPEYQKLKELDAAYKAASGGCAPRELSRIMEASKRLAKGDECTQRAEDHRIEQQSLLQAARVTNATEQGLLLTYQGTRVNVASAVLLFLTLAATAWAAFAASEATRIAKASEKDTATNLRIAQETSNAANRAADAAQRHADAVEQQLKVVERAYAYGAVEPEQLTTFSQQTVKLNIIVSNNGKTPARIRELCIGVFPEIAEGMVPHPTQPDYTHAKRYPTDTIFGSADSGPIGSIDDAPLRGIGYGQIIYDDIFGVRHFSRFFMKYDATNRTGGTVAGSPDYDAWNDCD
jgi:hypothetical protein